MQIRKSSINCIDSYMFCSVRTKIQFDMIKKAPVYDIFGHTLVVLSELDLSNDEIDCGETFG